MDSYGEWKFMSAHSFENKTNQKLGLHTLNNIYVGVYKKCEMNGLDVFLVYW